MLPHQVFELLRVADTPTPENALRKAWLSSHGVCKDAIALALPLKALPATLEKFREKLADVGKAQDWIIANFYVVYVGMADGREWGWSKVPYDSKKNLREELKPLYSVDKEGPFKDQTRFWSFKKVSSNMNKGPRIDEPVDGLDLSFVLPAGSCVSTFIREDNYESGKLLFEAGPADGKEDGMLDAYHPVILQLSGTNGEQSAKGNGLKVRRVVPVAREVLGAFSACFFSSPTDLRAAQDTAGELVPLKSVTKPVKNCPLLCNVNERAFLYWDEPNRVVEIVESGLDPELGQRLLVPEKMVLSALHSEDITRAMRMLSVAIGHRAVKCIFNSEQGSPEALAGGCPVIHLQVDLAAALLLPVLHASRDEPSFSVLPKNDCITMCLGRDIGSTPADDGTPLNHLQWYAPNLTVPVAAPDGTETMCHVVFVMNLAMEQLPGLRDVPSKLLLMDRVSGFHHLLKVFYVRAVRYDGAVGLECEGAKMIVTWQLRPGLGSSPASGVGAGSTTRKRACLAADDIDCGQSAGPAAQVSPEVSPPAELSKTNPRSPQLKRSKSRVVPDEV
jgi:hypothetical protein